MTSSIRGRLLVWLLGALILAGIVIGYAAYWRAHQDLDELLDYQLKQLAFSLSRQSVGSAPAAGTPSPRAGLHHTSVGSRRRADVLLASQPGHPDASAARFLKYGVERTGLARVHAIGRLAHHSGRASVEFAQRDGGGPGAACHDAARLFVAVAGDRYLDHRRPLARCHCRRFRTPCKRAIPLRCSRCQAAICPTKWRRW